MMRFLLKRIMIFISAHCNEVTIMTNHVITGKQMQAIFALFWIGSIIIAGVNPQAKQDSWISLLFAGLMSLPLIALYVRITHLYPGLNLFEILFKIFGRIFGRILSLFPVLFAIHLGSMVTNTFSIFIKIVNMPETPILLTTVFIVIVCSWSVKNGAENIGRLSKFVLPIVIVTSLITFIIAMKDMDLNNLKPIMDTNFKSLLSGAYSYLTLPFGEMVLCFSFFSSVNDKTGSLKILINSLVITISFYIMVIFRNILTLGVPSTLLFYFPSYESVSIISVGDFFSRIEVLIGIDLLLSGFIKTCVCLYTASLGLTKILNIQKQNSVVIPCALLIITISGMLYASSITNMEFFKYYPIYVIPIEFIFPLIIWIGAEIQNKIKTADTNPKVE
jgi:spore germination protein KB